MRLIDADKLLRDIEHYNLSDGKFQHWVEIQPSAEPERKKGEWIKTYRDGFGTLMGYCNQCRVRHPVDNFCANCGADMGEKVKRNEQVIFF